MSKTTAQEILDLQTRLEAAKQKLNKAVGSKDTLLQRLESDFGCSCLEDGETELEKLSKETERLTKLQERKLTEFKDKWEDQLSSIE